MSRLIEADMATAYARYARENRADGESDVQGTGNRSVLLIAHMDTVYLKGMLAKQPFRVDGDRLWVWVFRMTRAVSLRSSMR